MYTCNTHTCTRTRYAPSLSPALKGRAMKSPCCSRTWPPRPSLSHAALPRATCRRQCTGVLKTIGHRAQAFDQNAAASIVIDSAVTDCNHVHTNAPSLAWYSLSLTWYSLMVTPVISAPEKRAMLRAGPPTPHPTSNTRVPSLRWVGTYRK